MFWGAFNLCMGKWNVPIKHLVKFTKRVVRSLGLIDFSQQCMYQFWLTRVHNFYYLVYPIWLTHVPKLANSKNRPNLSMDSTGKCTKNNPGLRNVTTRVNLSDNYWIAQVDFAKVWRSNKTWQNLTAHTLYYIDKKVLQTLVDIWLSSSVMFCPPT